MKIFKLQVKKSNITKNKRSDPSINNKIMDDK